MPSSLLALPFRPVLNQNGEFESGATMTVYKQGTTTLEPLFSDAGLTTPLTNPVVADGYGVFPAVYWNDAQPIKLVIAESNGTTLFELDPYIATVFEAEAILDQAAATAADAEASAVAAATSAAAAAASEAVAIAFAGPSYANTAAGIAATVDGEFFYVLNAGVVEVYKNVLEVAVLQYSILSASAVQAAIDAKAPLVHTHVISDVTSLQTSLDAKAPLASPALTGTPTVGGIEVGYRKIPVSSTAGTAVASDSAKCIVATAGLTIPNAVYAAGDAISVYNDTGSAITITQGAGLTLRQAATANTGNRTLAQRGLATIWFKSASEAIISGAGVT